jgi:hypothetical protein
MSGLGHPQGGAEEGPLTDLDQHDAEHEAARQRDADAAAERARTGNTGGIY